MKVIRRIIREYIDGSIHVALSVYALIRITSLHFGLSDDPNIAIFAFCGSVLSYQFMNQRGLLFLHVSLARPWLLHVHWLFSAVLVCFLLYAAAKLRMTTLLLALAIAFVVLAYGCPRALRKKNLRQIPGLKILFVVSCWTGVCVGIPWSHSGCTWNTQIGEFALRQFLFILALTLPFEIRDRHQDSSLLRTWPQLLGRRGTQWLGVSLLIGFLALQPWDDVLRSYWTFVIALLVSHAFFFPEYYLRKPYYCSFWIEGIPILWWIGLWMLNENVV